MGSVGDAIERQNKYVYIDTTDPITVKTGEGFLIRVITGSNPQAGQLAFYDNTSATGIPILILSAVSAPTIESNEVNIPFSVGLTMQQTENDFFTVVYR